MLNVFRAVAALCAVILSYLVVLLLPFSFIHLPGGGLIEPLIAWGAALAAGIAVWTAFGRAPASLASNVIAGGCIVGGIAFCAGFIGPMILTPEANQGPMLGIFITGPLGVIVGLIGGWIYWRVKKR